VKQSPMMKVAEVATGMEAELSFHVKRSPATPPVVNVAGRMVSRETYTLACAGEKTRPTMKLIILDRDGVINEDSDAYIKSPEEWNPIPGSLEAITRLNHGGYRVVIATNQSGIGRGLLDLETLNQIHRKMHRMVQEVGGLIEAIFFCPDVDEANPFRKPNPGMLLEIGRRLKCNLQGAPVVGDSVRDIRAARAANAWPLLVRTGKGARTLEREAESCANVLVFDDLATVAEYLTTDHE